MALPDTFKLEPSNRIQTGIISRSIASGSSYTGVEIDNATLLNAYCALELIWQFGTAPTADKTLEVHLLYTPIGTGSGTVGYEDDSIDSLAFVVSPPADLNQHRRVKRWVSLLPFPFKPVVKNVDTGQTVTATLRLYTLNERVIE